MAIRPYPRMRKRKYNIHFEESCSFYCSSTADLTYCNIKCGTESDFKCRIDLASSLELGQQFSERIGSLIARYTTTFQHDNNHHNWGTPEHQAPL